MKPTLITIALNAAVLLAAAAAYSLEPCRVLVTDRENGWPVPLVELRTTHNVRFHTDNAGVVALDLPELFGRETWLFVESDGYEVPADGFGSRGVRVTPEPGDIIEIEVDRTIVAKRLGRLTGAGIFGESQKLGEHLDWKESGGFGSDSVQNAAHRGRMFWAWGDTVLAKYPLGLFHMTSATTEVAPLASFEPPLKLELDYFRDEDGRLRNVADVAPDDRGPTWVSGYVSLPDASGKPRLAGHYAKIEPPMSVYRTGLCVWNEETENFESVTVLWEKSETEPEPPAEPVGHPAFWTDEEGTDWVLFGDPFPTLRVPATFEAWRDPSQWETIEPPSTMESAADGASVDPHRGSIAWNEFRGRWVTIFCEENGDPSPLGEIWYAEADSPLGPWGKAVKVLSHRQYSFYNPRIHPEFSPEGSPILLFEGTYTQMFSAAPVETPRHNYNQILYRLDLDELELDREKGMARRQE
ncbi:MAG: hypothetical protein WD342_02760 [Verrucomicrobiales bacterium]